MIKIDHIRTVGFKGFDIDEDVPEKVIYSGGNKKGKTARSYAAAFALEGKVSFSTAGKLPGDVLDSFGKDSIASTVKIKGVEFGRRIARSESGKVSTFLRVNGHKKSSEAFYSELGKAGYPKIADYAAFMAQSDTKKVDDLFDLYPCPELATIDEEIKDAKGDVSRIEKLISGCESTISRLTTSKNAIEKPAGTIASVRDEIKTVEAKIADLEKQINDAEIEEAKAQGKDEGAKEERQKMVVESESGITIKQESFLSDDEPPLKTDEDWSQYDLSGPSNDPKMVEADQLISRMEQQFGPFDLEKSAVDHKARLKYEFFHASIQNIIDALNGSGCSTCAALIVAKQELKKYV
jgi:hypothetical protein